MALFPLLSLLFPLRHASVEWAACSQLPTVWSSLLPNSGPHTLDDGPKT